jgi:hypothetical protein
MAPYGTSDAVIRDEVEDLRDLADRFERENVSAADAKWMYQRAYSRSMSKEAAMEPVRHGREMERRRRREEP